MATQRAFRRTRTYSPISWRGTPDELRALAQTAIEAIEVARQSALRQYEAQTYDKYATDLAQLPTQLGITDLTTLDPYSPLGLEYAAKSQELWRGTQQSIDYGKIFVNVGHDFGWILKGGVQESQPTPDVFADASLPRNVAGVWVRSNVFASPTSSISIQLQNWPFIYLQVEVSGEDWVWMEATFSRVVEQIRRGESSTVGLLYRPTYTSLIYPVAWLVFSIGIYELIKILPYPWLHDRAWLAVVLGVIPIIPLWTLLAWLYPRFEVLRSIVREQTDATRWLIVGLGSAALIAIGRWLLSLFTRRP